MTLSRLLQTTVLIGLSCLLPSCAGYKMGADKPSKMAGVTSLAIPVFKNLTLEPRSSVIVTNNVIKKFQMDPPTESRTRKTPMPCLRERFRNSNAANCGGSAPMS